MNERIKELFKRAGGKTSIHNLMSNPIQHREYNELWNDNIQKFAELIVRECAKVCDDLDLDDWGDKSFDDGTYYCSRAIKKHFGVE